MTIPAAQQYLNYPGDVREHQWVGRRVGPNTLREILYVVSWEYDEEQDKTRVGFAYINPIKEDK